jgi:RiboL-PSP-HEPN
VPNAIAIEQAATEFLRATDQTYQECAGGIAQLDRLIVNVSSSMADHARVYLLPCLYAYWERYYRILFGEFLRCVSLIGIHPADGNTELVRNHIFRGLKRLLKNQGVKALEELPHHCDVLNTRAFLSGLVEWVDTPISFADPDEWVITTPNIKFEVLQEMCRVLGLNILELKQKLDERKLSIYQGLQELVLERNRIAHGESFEIVSQETWERLKNFLLDLMNALQFFLYEALQNPINNSTGGKS